ncbi:hypothetical protein BaRGS_00011627 [Batillaria attramentaria]|uniref:Uncharacterized protein n=1 Tax=Batillaria attramentaria TaxID=370345 RepID=A0ABD0LDP5_9CAEN
MPVLTKLDMKDGGCATILLGCKQHGFLVTEKTAEAHLPCCLAAMDLVSDFGIIAVSPSSTTVSSRSLLSTRISVLLHNLRELDLSKMKTDLSRCRSWSKCDENSLFDVNTEAALLTNRSKRTEKRGTPFLKSAQTADRVYS